MATKNSINSIASAAEVNILDGATLDTTELNYVDGVTSAIQTQLNAKQASDTQLTSLATLSYTGNAGKFIRVNAGETDFELAAVSGGGLTVGSTAIASGTNTKVLYNNAGTLGEYTISGSGDVAMTTSPTFITPILGTPTSGNLANCTFPTLNQNTTGSAASLSISGQTGLLTFTGLTSVNRAKTVRDAADTILELGGSYTPTGTWTSMTLVTPALGTPASGTLTNCTSLPVSGITSSTVTALGVGSLEIGHASDTTLARVSAGVASIEGNTIVVNTSSPTLGTITTTGSIELGNASDTTLSRSAAGELAIEGIPALTTTNTKTVTNKRNQLRTGTVASSATPTINTDNVTYFSITALATAITSMTTNLTGTPVESELLWISITDNGTARGITWGASFESSGNVTLPITTVISTRLDVLLTWNPATNKWRCISVA